MRQGKLQLSAQDLSLLSTYHDSQAIQAQSLGTNVEVLGFAKLPPILSEGLGTRWRALSSSTNNRHLGSVEMGRHSSRGCRGHEAVKMVVLR